MRHVAVYLLAVLGGNQNPTEKDLTAILASVGIDADSEKLAKVCSELKGKNVKELMEAGLEKLASVPAGGAAPAAGGAAPAAGGAAPAAAKEPEPESESEEDDMGFGLFD
eukprot:Nk52_evm9s123 gene=Nk52_evmTU9s123